MNKQTGRVVAALIGLSIALAAAPGAVAQEQLPPYGQAFTFQFCEPQLSGAAFAPAVCAAPASSARRDGQIKAESSLSSPAGGRSHARHQYGGTVVEGLRVPAGARRVDVVVEGVLSSAQLDWSTVGWSSATVYATACVFRSSEECSREGAHTASQVLLSSSTGLFSGSVTGGPQPFTLAATVQDPRGKLTLWATVKADLRLGTCVTAGVCDGSEGTLRGSFTAAIEKVRVTGS